MRINDPKWEAFGRDLFTINAASDRLTDEDAGKLMQATAACALCVMAPLPEVRDVTYRDFAPWAQECAERVRNEVH